MAPVVDGSGTDGAGSLGEGEPTNETQLGLSVHVLRVTLLDVSPLVWRLVRVPSAITLSALHAVLQLAMGSEDRHLHEWRVGDDVYTLADEEDWGEDVADEAAAVLGEIAGVDSVFRYDYDLGDGWEHLVEVVAVEVYDGTVPPGRGARRGPLGPARGLGRPRWL